MMYSVTFGGSWLTPDIVDELPRDWHQCHRCYNRVGFRSVLQVRQVRFVILGVAVNGVGRKELPL
jgi:hypothetical protein